MISSKLALKVDDSLSGLKNVPPAKPTFLKKKVEGGKKTLKVVWLFSFFMVEGGRLVLYLILRFNKP